MIQPLEANEIAGIDTAASERERFWHRVPIFGWVVADMMWVERTRPIVEKIERQLKSRTDSALQIWGVNTSKTALAHYVCRVAADEMGWSSAYFIPDDPAEVVFWAHQDGLDVEAAVQEIEQHLGIRLEDAEVDAWFQQTMGEVIDFLWSRQQAAHHQENA